MEEGLNLNLVLNGATLLSVLGLAVKVYLASKKMRIEQPIDVRTADGSVGANLCNDRHGALNAQTSNLFSRMSAAEQRIATLEGTITEVKEQYKNIDDKLTVLLRRK
ncbi:MAG: hypothetical protein PHG96_13850 [Kiritimatiellae bacterium]|nr:hypothetical protein [Kiritimatiellia bacterium]